MLEWLRKLLGPSERERALDQCVSNLVYSGHRWGQDTDGLHPAFMDAALDAMTVAEIPHEVTRETDRWGDEQVKYRTDDGWRQAMEAYWSERGWEL